MIQSLRNSIPQDHPLRAAFHQLTERGMLQLQIRDEDTIEYVSNLLIDFVHPENLARVRDADGNSLMYVSDILKQARQMSLELRLECYRHLGDRTLFDLGLFPESLTYGHRTVSRTFLANQGRLSYSAVAEMEEGSGPLFRKLSQQYLQCVAALNWVKIYINDPFYQYVFREFQVI